MRESRPQRDVKFDLRRKYWVCAGGHKTDPPKDDRYSRVVGMEAIRLLFLISSLNGHELCAGDISNAYLYAQRREKLYVVAREDFGEHCGKVMLIVKSWYGLKTSAAAWAEHWPIPSFPWSSSLPRQVQMCG